MHTTYSLSVLIRNIQDENNIHANLIITYSLIQSHKKTQEKISQQRIYIRIKRLSFKTFFLCFSYLRQRREGQTVAFYRNTLCAVDKRTVKSSVRPPTTPPKKLFHYYLLIKYNAYIQLRCKFSPLLLWLSSQDPELSGKGTLIASAVLGVEVKGSLISFVEAK